ncbi:hypothetical protein A3A37_01715 [Candidatus Kaiserbacteria bacterium RIFCSPLOWO2_01_FULL_52_36]|nr:MAG: hypothetical protein A3A37_01715 [Candidatus Kaiserbacteria bacterium RIFCSPLOWO2_01_FULL_52_36]
MDSLSVLLKKIQVFFSKGVVQNTPQQPSPIQFNEVEIKDVSKSISNSPDTPIIETPVKPLDIIRGFLICPIQMSDGNETSVTPFTVKISAVVDHSGTELDPNWESPYKWGRNAKNQKVEAFNGEVGEGLQCPQEPCGYPKKDSGEFFKDKQINYVGVSSDGGKFTLQYDGHAGYDFPYQPMTAIIAPADGQLFKASQGKDRIYGANWDKDHSFYIEHANGFVTWFRHCEKLRDEIEKVIGNNFERSFKTSKGQPVAFSGDFESYKKGGTKAHLHFEVRDSKGKIVDPYEDKLWI